MLNDLHAMATLSPQSKLHLIACPSESQQPVCVDLLARSRREIHRLGDVPFYANQQVSRSLPCCYDLKLVSEPGADLDFSTEVLRMAAWWTCGI